MKVKPLTIPASVPTGDPNWKVMLQVKNQAFTDRKKEAEKKACRKKIIE